MKKYIIPIITASVLLITGAAAFSFSRVLPPSAPNTPCRQDECGPIMGIANRICPDGSVAGPVCVRMPNGTCGYKIRSCSIQVSSSSRSIVGGDRDKHGCIPSAGYSWCASKMKCLRLWEEPCDSSSAASIACPPGSRWNGTKCSGLDEHGCVFDGGYSWCGAKQKCLRPWEEKCVSTSSSPGNPVCGNGICEHGEATRCPAVQPRPGMMNPLYCIRGSCPQDCTGSSFSSSLAGPPTCLTDADCKNWNSSGFCKSRDENGRLFCYPSPGCLKPGVQVCTNVCAGICAVR
jgi:hypothetical protein